MDIFGLYTHPIYPYIPTILAYPQTRIYPNMHKWPKPPLSPNTPKWWFRYFSIYTSMGVLGYTPKWVSENHQFSPSLYIDFMDLDMSQMCTSKMTKTAYRGWMSKIIISLYNITPGPKWFKPSKKWYPQKWMFYVLALERVILSSFKITGFPGWWFP